MTLVAVALLVQFIHCWYAGLLPAYAAKPIAVFAPLAPVFFAFVFERLASKQWLSIIGEQVALVNDKHKEIEEIKRGPNK